MRYERIQKKFATVVFYNLAVVQISGCNTGGDVSHHPVQTLDNVVHVLSGGYLLTSSGNIIISRDQLVHSNDQDEMIDGKVSLFVQVNHLDHIVKVVNGENRHFALKENGQVWFWGEPLDYEPRGLFNMSPQLKRPKKFPKANHVIDIWSSEAGIMFKKRDGTVWGWHPSYGRVPTEGDLSDPDFSSNKVRPYPWLANAKDIGNYLTFLNDDGSVWESRDNALFPISGLQDIVEISEGYPVDRNGTVWTWGST